MKEKIIMNCRIVTICVVVVTIVCLVSCNPHGLHTDAELVPFAGPHKGAVYIYLTDDGVQITHKYGFKDEGRLCVAEEKKYPNEMVIRGLTSGSSGGFCYKIEKDKLIKEINGKEIILLKMPIRNDTTWKNSGCEIINGKCAKVINVRSRIKDVVYGELFGKKRKIVIVESIVENRESDYRTILLDSYASGIGLINSTSYIGLYSSSIDQIYKQKGNVTMRLMQIISSERH